MSASAGRRVLLIGLDVELRPLDPDAVRARLPHVGGGGRLNEGRAWPECLPR